VDIESILNSLGLDLTNPEIKRGAIEAIEAILDSRAPSMSMDSVTGGMSGEQDVELDPDLLQPSIKNKPQESSDDVEINDEDDVLKNIKHNDSEDSEESSMSNENESGDSDDESDSSDTASSSSKSSGSQEKNSDDNVGESEPEDGSDEISSEESDDSDADNDGDTDETDDGTNSTLSDKGSEDDSEKDSQDDGEMSAEETADSEDEEIENSTDNSEGDSGKTEGPADESEETEDELDIDEDDLLDDNLKNTYDDQEQVAKHEARKIKRERTLQAAKQALADAQAKKKAPALIRELEKAIEALESLQEAVAKNLKAMSDEEFNLIVNRVFDAIDALGDSGLTYTSEEERKVKAQEIKADIENRQTQAELSAEDVAKIRAETQVIKAREKENAKYQRRSRGSFKGFQDFLSSLYRAIALQVHTEETQDDTWSAINRRYSGTGVLQQGKRINELPNKKIPVIDFYFDQSGSWDESDIAVGKKAVEALVDMEEKGQIKINIYYFANQVHTDADSARREGGTWAWNDIVKNVITTQATNVIIMTDSDMEDRWDYENYWHQGKAASYTVPGYVWYLWRNGSNAPRLPRDLKGRGGTQQFSFNQGDL
jgi:hypothetical protein